MAKRPAFFEGLDEGTYPIAVESMKAGSRAYAFRISLPSGKRREIEKWISSGSLVDLSQRVFAYELYREAACQALQGVDRVFAKRYSSSPSIRVMARLLGFPAITDMYKYRMLSALEERHCIELKVKLVMGEYGASKAVFFPSGDAYIHTSGMTLLPKGVEVAIRDSLTRRAGRIASRIKRSLMLAAPFYLLFRKIGLGKKGGREQYAVGIMDDHPENTFLMNYFGNDVFVGKGKLGKEDTLFITPWQKDSRRLESEKGLHAASVYDGRCRVPLGLLLSILPAWAKASFFSLWEEPLVTETNRSILLNYMAWNIFLENYGIRNYVRRLLPDNIAKTHILSQHGVKTWFVFPDNTTYDYHLAWPPEKQNQTLFTFMHFDNAVLHGDAVERWFRKHRNFIKNYEKVGVMFSQVAKEIEGGELKSPIFSLLRERKMPKKIIAVFDTTFDDAGPVKIEDGVRFAEGILRLLDEMPEIGVIFKSAKERNLTPPAIRRIYDKLQAHERCLFFYRYDKGGISAPEVIAASYLTISAAYPSTTAEALGAGKRGMYYDSGGRHTGPGYYFNRFPHFVAHDYDGLKKEAKYWLGLKESGFRKFLDKYARDEIDPYLDSRAMSRLAELLME